jgi:hypothetical protein
MADYKLRLDVDAKELEKKLTKAFQTAMSGLNLGGTGGGASSTVNSIGNATIQLGKYNKIIGQQTASLQDLKDAMTEMMNLEHKQALELNEANKLRQTSIRLLAKENALIRLSQSSGTTFRNIGQLFGGQIGGGTGKGIDYILSNISMFKTKKTLNRQFKELALKEAKGQYETGKISDIEYGFKTQEIGEKYKDTKLDKFFDSAKKQYSESRFGQSKAGKAVSVLGKGAGVPVKVAGIAAGFAGAMGLGKMIIDSSPMLQSMLKLLNVGIMLILRPIGDFIGFMLRPLLIEFVKKVAVPAYREGAKAAKEWGTKVGKALLLAFTNPGKFFTEGLINPLIKGATILWFDLEAQLKNLGAMLAPWVFNKEEEYTKNLKEAEEKKAAIDIPTLWDSMENSEISNKIQDLTGELPEVTRSQDQLGATTCFNSQVGQQVSQGVTQQIGVLTQNNGNLLDNTSSTDKNSTEIDRNTTQMGQLEKVMEHQRQLEEQRQKKLEEQRARNRATIDNSYDSTTLSPSTGKPIDAWAEAKARVTEDALKAEADRAAEYYGGFANPDFAWDGRTSAERIADAEAAAEAARNAGPGDIMKKRYEELDALNKRLAKETTPQPGSGGYYNPSIRGDPISEGAINPATGRPYSARDIMGTTVSNPYQGMDVGRDKLQNLLKDKGANYFADIIEKSLPTKDEISDIEASQDETIQSFIDSNDRNVKANEEMVDLGSDMLSNKQVEQKFAQCSMYNAEMINDHFKVMENEVDDARVAGINIAEGLESLWERVQKALRKLSVQTDSQGNKTKDAKAAGEASAEMNTSSKAAYTAGRYMIGYCRSGEFVEHGPYTLDAAAVKFYEKTKGAKLRKLARGGIINEPILGLGQRTGNQYLMGENGPETITPGANTSIANGGSTFNITINASGVGDIERQLKPAILRMLKESTARAGIV